MKKFTFLNFIALIIWLLPLLFIVWVYPSLPVSVPVHFDANGNPNGYGSRSEFVGIQVFMLAVSAGIYLLMLFLPSIDPKPKAKYSEGTIQKMGLGVVFLISVLCIAVTLVTTHHGLKIQRLILPFISLFFTFIGNMMYNIKPNYFAGIRTPWTLENEDNWRATHQLAGKIWFGGGLVIAGLTLLLHADIGFIIFMIGIAIMTLVPIIYSYIYFKKHQLK